MKNIGKIIAISRPLYHIVGILAFLIVITSLLALVTPILSKFIVDEIVAKVQGQGGSVQRLFFLIAIAFSIEFFNEALRSVSNRLGDHLSGRMRKYLTEKFYQKVLSLPQSYFDSEISGKIVNQLNRGIMMIYTFMNTASNFILPTFLQSIFTITVMSLFNSWVALFTFSLFPVYLVLSFYSAKRWGAEEEKKNKIEDYSRGRIHEVINNIKLVKGFSNERNEFTTISKNLGEINTIYARQSKTYHIFDFLRNFSLQLIFALVSVIVFYNTFIGKLTIGEMVLLLQLFNQARLPLFAMSYILQQIQSAESGSKEFFEVLTLKSVEPFDGIRKTDRIQNPKIEFQNVSFKYEKSDVVLNDVSFTLAANEKVALVGHSGVGKSTIASLILKLYTPTSGEILLNRKPYGALDHTYIRNNIALVFQENELFSSTVRENVAYGDSHASEKDIIHALKLANAWEFVKNLPHGLDSEVGERGVRLSGGQKQRIQIARAILKNAPILILDEATSSLDSKSEREVQEALENLMRNKLVIIIAHRFSTIQNVDKIIVVDEGRIVDCGTPKELSTKKGIYSDLLHYQIEGNKKLLEQFELY